MITKAYVEDVYNEYQYKVRIPLLDRIESSVGSVDFDDLSIATACVPKGINASIRKGDVVFVAFEEDDYDYPIIIGHLYRSDLIKDSQMPFIESRNLTVTEKAVLPKDTKIGDITYEQIAAIAHYFSTIQLPTDGTES